MKVILLETLSNLGNVGQVVNVKPGYARNFLFPKKKAMMADSENMRQVEHQNRMLEKRIEKAKSESEKAKTAIEKTKLVLSRKSAGEGKLFGSVTNLDIQKEIEKLGFTVSRKGIELSGPIKKSGSYEVPIKLDGDIMATIKLTVEAEDAKAEESGEMEMTETDSED